MKHVNMKMVLGLAVSMIFLFGALAAPVSALQTNIKIETYNQAYASGVNNHTYMYVEPDPLDFVTRSYLHANVDMDYTQYQYDNTGWSALDDTVSEDTNAPFYWQEFDSFTAGLFGNDATLPLFYDFEASDGSEFVVNSTLETRSYSLALGQHTSVIADAGFMYVGTLGLGGSEFVHLTVASKQDAVSWTVAVLDPEGRHLTSYMGFDGDIWTIPFKASIAGTYYVLLEANPSSGTFSMFDLLPVAITPTNIALGEVITGTLTAGEIIVDPDTGSWVQEEMAPTTHTYVVNSPNDVSSVTYAFNYGGLFDTQPEYIMFTSGDFEYTYNGGSRYSEMVALSPITTTGEYFYRGGPYYVTVMGGDNTEYTLYNRANSQGVLPVNQEFQFENYLGATVTHAYLLDVEDDSMLRVNSTATGGDLTVRLTGVYENGYRNDRTISYAANILSSAEYYLPAGDYFVEMAVDDGVNEWVEYNIGPLTTNTTAEIVDMGGFIVDTDIFQMYNMTIFLNNQDNVTVALDVTIYDASGRSMYSAGMLLANRWDGSQIQPHPTYWDNATFLYSGHDWYDSHAFVGICAYLVSNNTEIPATNDYSDYPVDLTIQWTNSLNDYFVNIENLDVSAGAAAYNFSLPAIGVTDELHGLLLNTTPGVWYNVSVMTAFVPGFNSLLHSGYDGRTHRVPWGDLSDELVGTLYTDFSFQFGAISENSFLELDIARNPTNDGFLLIQITPMETHPLLVAEVTPLGPDILGILGAVAIPAVVGVGVIVVVYIVYVKKFKK
ncbi:MAG: hypothetical protein KGD60_07545 [Candidatus Thorarchaeota archaeon]|nr:hypothetical protein [Candidatus Thorarchaeota archaeon]